MPPYFSSDDTVLYIENTRVLRRRGSARAQELVVLDNGFVAVDLAQNSSGSLLAVAARDALNIWIIDGLSAARRLRVENMPFDEDIQKIVWHPCAREDACLVVLMQHSVVSVFCPPGQDAVVEKTHLADAEQIELDIAGANFGSTDSPTGPLTLYVATTDGDIYALCPFAPPEVELPRGRFVAAAKLASLGSWPIELDSWSRKHGEVTILKRPAFEELPSWVSAEPLRLTPYPTELYSEAVLDLAVAGMGSAWATDLVVQTTTNYVNFYITDDPMSSTLVLVSSVKFSRAQSVRKVRLATPKLVIVDTQTESHVLHIEDWVKALACRRVSPENDHDLALPPTRVESVALSYAYITRRAVDAIPVAGGPSRSWPLEQLSQKVLADSVAKLSMDNGSFVRQADNSWDACAKVVASPEYPPTTVLGPTLAALGDLDRLSQSYESKALLLLKGIIEIQFGRQAQGQELLAQLERASALSERIEAAESKASDLPKAVEAAVKRQAQLNQRIEKVASDVRAAEEKQAASRPLSAAEQEWFDELEQKLSVKINSAETQFQRLQEAAANLRTLRDGPQSHEAPRKLSRTQLHSIKRRLEQQEDLISSLQKHLQSS